MTCAALRYYGNLNVYFLERMGTHVTTHKVYVFFEDPSYGLSNVYCKTFVFRRYVHLLISTNS